MKAPSLTLGIEEEDQILGPETGELRDEGVRLVEETPEGVV